MENSAPSTAMGRSSFDPFVSCFTSKLPPFSRGGSVRSPSVAAGPRLGTAPVASGGKTKPPRASSSFSRFVHACTCASDGATPDTPMNDAPGMRTPGSFGDVAQLSRICQERRREDVAKEPEPWHDCGERVGLRDDVDEL